MRTTRARPARRCGDSPTPRPLSTWPDTPGGSPARSAQGPLEGAVVLRADGGTTDRKPPRDRATIGREPPPELEALVEQGRPGEDDPAPARGPAHRDEGHAQVPDEEDLPGDRIAGLAEARRGAQRVAERGRSPGPPDAVERPRADVVGPASPPQAAQRRDEVTANASRRSITAGQSSDPAHRLAVGWVVDEELVHVGVVVDKLVGLG